MTNAEYMRIENMRKAIIDACTEHAGAGEGSEMQVALSHVLVRASMIMGMEKYDFLFALESVWNEIERHERKSR